MNPNGRSPAGIVEIIRDPLWDNIELDEAAMAVLDTPAMQRLRYVRQLGHAFLVYPGATHSRFEHALGAYHLTGRALGILDQRGELHSIGKNERLAIRLAALLHDVGHYPFSHSLEEAGFQDHESLGVARLGSADLEIILTRIGGPDLIRSLGELIQGLSANPLGGLISGSLDLDKVDYLSRDARACGVPYGTLDVDRLLASLTVVRDDAGYLQVGVLEKGVSALESMLFAKYQMYRNVYWHHAVRAATCMFKRAVRATVAAQSLDQRGLADTTDEALMERLSAADPTGLAQEVRERKLFKRALDISASDVPEGGGDWISERPDLLERAEDVLALEVGLEPGDVLIDFPTRTNMLSVDLLLKTREGEVERLTDEGRAGQLGLPRIAGELYRSARRLRIFSRRPIAKLEGIVAAVILPADEVADRVSRGKLLD